LDRGEKQTKKRKLKRNIETTRKKKKKKEEEELGNTVFDILRNAIFHR
jgi:hypothetical protein